VDETSGPAGGWLAVPFRQTCGLRIDLRNRTAFPSAMRFWANGGKRGHIGSRSRAQWLWLPLLLLPGLIGAETTSNPGSRHWAFTAPAAVNPPAGSDSRGGNALDAFLDAALQRRGIRPAAAASRTELLRRVTYDLTGLPPTPAEVESFQSDASPGAYERVVGRLLAAPAFGERWAQHWLDLAHYADSNGFELDADRPDAWRYRDWVIRAFNEDLPYDRFVQMQVAGDELAPGDPAALIAAGFARAGPREVVSGNIDPEVRRQNELTEATGTVGSVFLGLTLGCARCHDHKFDPLPATDYYGLQAFFAGAQLTEVRIHDDHDQERFERETQRITSQIKPLEAALKKLEEPYRARLAQAKEENLTEAERALRDKPKESRTPEEARLVEGIGVALQVKWEEVAEAFVTNTAQPADFAAREALKRQVYDLERQLPPPPARAMTLTETCEPIPETRLLGRGDVKNKRAVVEPHPPRILLTATSDDASAAGGFALPTDPIDDTHSGRRLALARWLTSPDNPLTARVIVNRLWQHHFGRGLVGTPSDFGTHGDPPINRELLDWLALELMRNGWHLKPLHRLMVTSRAYQRSSSDHREVSNGTDLDPSNRLLWRTNRRRMEAEGLRDSVLAVAGLLNQHRSGPGAHIYLEPEVESLIFTEAEVVELWPEETDPAVEWRRSAYLHRKRNVHYPIFDAFDVPDAQTPCPQRPVSTHAPQALVMLNSRFAQSAARAFAASLLREGTGDPDRIREAFLRCHARPPTPAELKLTQDFLDGPPESRPDRWTDFALALLNSNEFIHVP
jgi:hypothetical protein